ncbi:MAG: squalene/phytoene synthase family protein [Nitrospinae bacterium]|nr:squalene/phytoene synthase family protein [Nitrospinota bacterium]
MAIILPMKNGHLKRCWEILPAVSRSFALCIQKLPAGLDEKIMLAYLVFRVIDTIEDSSAPLETKEEAFAEFLALMEQRPVDEKRFGLHRDMLVARIDHTYERALFDNVPSVFEVFYGFGAEERAVILKYAREMVEGMLKFQNTPIADFKAQEEYCYYVAGIVGYLNTHLFHLSGHIGAELRDELLGLSKNFGIALQKVNVLRDVAYDIPQGRKFWPLDVLQKHGLTYETLCAPERRADAMKVLAEMVENALPYLEDAIEYTTRLPRFEVRVRVFCLIPLFMALESYAKCVGNEDIFNSGKTVKISKEDVARIVRHSFVLSPFNGALRRWFRSCTADVRQKLSATNGR